MSHLHSGSSFISQSVQSELDGKVALVSATKQTIGSALDVSGNINLPTGSQYQINGVSITAGGGGGGGSITTDLITFTGQQISIVNQGSSTAFGSGSYTIGIGFEAGNYIQQTSAIAIGKQSGTTNQGENGIAIGELAGWNTQSTRCIAIGRNAGGSYQADDAIAIGSGAGITNQGVESIAIGSLAGKNYQARNSICINATGIELNNQTQNSCVIKPIRNETNLSGFLQLYYNPTTGELVYN